ncbi:hypothetical protein Cgig2_016682 [Carnegiea gigantea]|uniref:Uncharacterized protein n=1 Tax=Carnegiea gigantea TaxID=171969 RepID=A0A9Q1QSL5_9CARY|nr:hypothetical protein Cgig2_016682 [Carnegiea gigantea]
MPTTGASTSSSARYVVDIPPYLPNQLVSKELITPKPMDSKIAYAELMKVESMSPSPPGFPKVSFKDIVRGDPLDFATASSIVEQLHEALEEEIVVLETTVRYDVLSQRLPLLWKPHETKKKVTKCRPKQGLSNPSKGPTDFLAKINNTIAVLGPLPGNLAKALEDSENLVPSTTDHYMVDIENQPTTDQSQAMQLTVHSYADDTLDIISTQNNKMQPEERLILLSATLAHQTYHIQFPSSLHHGDQPPDIGGGRPPDTIGNLNPAYHSTPSLDVPRAKNTGILTSPEEIQRHKHRRVWGRNRLSSNFFIFLLDLIHEHHPLILILILIEAPMPDDVARKVKDRFGYSNFHFAEPLNCRGAGSGGIGYACTELFGYKTTFLAPPCSRSSSMLSSVVGDGGLEHCHLR